jgi:hypothetical protein
MRARLRQLQAGDIGSRIDCGCRFTVVSQRPAWNTTIVRLHEKPCEDCNWQNKWGVAEPRKGQWIAEWNNNGVIDHDPFTSLVEQSFA